MEPSAGLPIVEVGTKTDRRQPEIHEVCTFGENSVTPKVHLTARIDVKTFVGDFFATDYLTPTWHRIYMFSRNYINGSVEWISVCNFLSNDGLPLTLNFLDPYANWGYRGSSISPNLSSVSGVYSDSFSIKCNCPARLLPIFHQKLF